MIDLYLARLGLDRVPEGAAGLAALQRAHMSAIAFENVDPLLGVVPDLAPEALIRKMLTDRRGGYCYEHNSLFALALHAAGHTVQRVLGRVRHADRPPGTRSHLALLVPAEGRRFLCDTGFGGPGPRLPLALAPGEQDGGNGTFRLVPDAATGEQVLERRGPDGWRALYGFDEAHVTDADVRGANQLSATWDQSPFPGNLMVAGYDREARIGLFNRALTLDGGGEQRRETLASVAGLEQVLCGRLKLPFDAATLARIWQRLPAEAA